MNLFELAFPVAAPFWAFMIFAPGWSVTRRVARSPFMVLPSLFVYFLAVAPILPHFAAEMLSPDLAGVRDILTTTDGTTLVWAHLIAFDLFIGAWMYRDSRERIIHPLVMAPILVLTILLSPFGLTAYLAVRRPASRAAEAGPCRASTSASRRPSPAGPGPTTTRRG